VAVLSQGLQTGCHYPKTGLTFERGCLAPTMSEQVYPQSKVFALIMLWYEPADDPDFD
jgi:hypothetical protein